MANSASPADTGSHAKASSQAYTARGWRIWFGLLGGLAAWIVHVAIAYPLVYNGCALGLNSVQAWLLGLTAVLALVALAATLVAFHTLRTVDANTDHGTTEPLGSRHMLAIMGIGLSGLSTLIIVLSGIVIVGLGPCR